MSSDIIAPLAAATGPDREFCSISYEMAVRWTTFDGSKLAVHWKSHEGIDPDEVFANAARLGWTRRKWWQWWRWRDTPNPPAKPAGRGRIGG